MAPTLRYIHKLTSHLITSKHLAVFQIKNFAGPCKQYSGNIQPQIHPSQYDDIENAFVSDNRETSNDVVTKINLFDRLHFAEAHKREAILNSTPAEEDSSKGRPPADKLLHVYTVLSENLPKLFIQSFDYSIYHEHMVFEDNIRNVRTVGLLNYAKQVALLRAVGHLRFAYVKFDILKITQHPEDGTVRVRWRIKGISALKVMLNFWKFKLWELKGMIDGSSNWYDGFSTFVVNEEGKIVKHVADKMMPDSDSVIEEAAPNLDNAKLGLLIGLMPRFPDVSLSCKINNKLYL